MVISGVVNTTMCHLFFQQTCHLEPTVCVTKFSSQGTDFWFKLKKTLTTSSLLLIQHKRTHRDHMATDRATCYTCAPASSLGQFWMAPGPLLHLGVPFVYPTLFPWIRWLCFRTFSKLLRQACCATHTFISLNTINRCTANDSLHMCSSRIPMPISNTDCTLCWNSGENADVFVASTEWCSINFWCNFTFCTDPHQSIYQYTNMTLQQLHEIYCSTVHSS